jgi:hypothetical protein
MDSENEKILFLGTAAQRHAILHSDQKYTRHELAVLLAAFRKSLVAADPRKKRRTQDPPLTGLSVDRIIAPGYIIDRL